MNQNDTFFNHQYSLPAYERALMTPTEIELQRICAEAFAEMYDRLAPEFGLNGRNYLCEQIPTITPETEQEAIDWAKMWGITSNQTPASPSTPPEKPLPTFHNRPRLYAKNLKDWEEL